MVSLAQIQEVPSKNMILLVGPPGSGKSTFCHQAILQNLALDRPIIYVTTECGPSEAERALRERGLGEIAPGMLNFVDAYNETVGVSVSDRPDTALAECEDLSSIGIAISKLQDRIERKGALLVFDSLTSPYLFGGSEVLRFMRRTLSGFAAKGNSVLVLMDEGCAKEEDLGIMMSMANGIIRMEVEEGSRVLNVVKHPVVRSTRIEIPTPETWEKKVFDVKFWDPEMIGRFVKGWQSGDFREMQRYLSVNLFWPNFMRWSGVLWDPKRLPKISYEAWKQYGFMTKDVFKFVPWHMKLLLKLFYRLPQNLSKPKDMKKLLKFFGGLMGEKGRRDFIMEYLDDVSKTDEHYIRIYENVECWGFEKVNTTMALWIPPTFAGACEGFEKDEREWNAVETKCVGLGDPYCEIKLVRGEIDELELSLEKDIFAIERIHESLVNRLMEYLLEGKPLVERRSLGSDFLMGMSDTALSSVAGERYEMAYRMGGAKVGREVGQRLIDAGIGEDEAVKRIIDFLNDCKVGKATLDGTIKVKNNCEARWTIIYMMKREQPSCFFTTGFLNGFFLAVKNQHVKETKCIAMGDPYCEWEFR